MGWWKKIKKCLICEKKCGNVYTTLKYRYQDEKVSEVYICEKCSEEYDVENMQGADNG